MAPSLRVTLLVAGAALIAGCAVTGTPKPVRVSPPPAAEDPLDVRGTAEPAADLAAAREHYFEGVRAFVREDLEEARDLFGKSRSAAGEPTAYPTVSGRHDAEILVAKTTYFLGKIGGDPDTEDVRDGGEAAGRSTPPWEQRHGAIEPAENDDVERWMRYFLGDGRPVFRKWLERKDIYRPVFDEVLARHGLPPELTYHAMIESGYSTSAYSWAHAVGLWQFIRTTGRKYGLRSDWWVDERRDPAKSTDAAARYLIDLYEEFQDWELALAAYNVGEYKIRRQIDHQKTRDFWQLKLPRETRNHIPKFYAALRIGSDPRKYGFGETAVPQKPTDTIVVDFSVDFEVLGECCGGVSAATLAELNPALVRRATPPDEEGYPVAVPAGTGERALAALRDLPAERRIRWAHHRVKGGDTLSEIAERYRTSVYAISQANNMRSVNRLRIGQELLIPQGQKTAVAPPNLARSDGPTTSRKITYVVRNGDTLSEIADRHGMSSRQLRNWNRLGRYIYPGQKLTIWEGARASSSSATVVQVRRGDTLWEIAKRHGVSLTSLLRENGLSKASLIRPGDRIKVPRS